MVRAILASGRNEIGVHGWIYLNADNMGGLGEATPGSSAIKFQRI